MFMCLFVAASKVKSMGETTDAYWSSLTAVTYAAVAVAVAAAAATALPSVRAGGLDAALL